MNILSGLLIAMLLQTAPQPAATSSVEGKVLKAGTTEALKAAVELQAVPGDSVRYRVLSSDDGRFFLPSVKPGQYHIAVTSTGYVSTEYGKRKPSGRGTIIEVADGQPVRDLRVYLTPTGAISGRVIDKIGQPMVKAEVQALKPSYQDGVRILTPVQSAVTNDLGEYRLFWLPPGSYFVAAIGPSWGTGNAVSIIIGPGAQVTGLSGFGGGNGGFTPFIPARLADESTAPTSRYETVYYPNTADDQAAQPIEVAAAGEANADIILSAFVHTRHLRVTAADETNGPPPTQYRLSPLPAVLGVPNNKPYKPEGVYDTDISTATTILTLNAPFATPLPRDAPVPLRMGRITIPAGESDLDNIQILMKAGKTLQGQIVLEGAAGAGAPKMSSFQVALTTEPKGLVQPFAMPRAEGTASDKGLFTLPNVFEGDYHVSITPILNLSATTESVPAGLQNTYIKSLRFGDTDVLNGLLRIPGPPDAMVTIVVANNAGSLTGTAVTDKQELVGAATVVLVPANRNRSDLYRSAKTNESGQFKIDRILPGDYKLLAWDEVEPGAWRDAQFMKPYEEMGTPIHIDENSSKNLRVVTISAQ